MKLPGLVWWRWLRARLAARPDTEHEQAIVRLVLGLLLGLYLLPEWTGITGADPQQFGAVAFTTYLALSFLVLVSILRSNAVSPARRVLATAIDVAMVSWTMWYFGARGMPLVLVYVWVTLANGFRFGPRYLLISLGLSVIGFGAVLATDAFWREHLGEGLGLVLGLVALSFYVLSLVTRMFDALARAEAANQAKRRFISVVSHEMRTPLNKE
jgi:two-component system sensor histidine kinase RpfC